MEDSKKFEDYEQSKPTQLTLFELFSGEVTVSGDGDGKNTELERNNKLSNLVALYDFMPKFVWSKNTERIEGRFLEILERDFEYKGKRYELKIVPARLKDKDGVSRDYYPGKLEESVEAALRKLVCEGQGVFLDEKAAVTFSLYQIQEELKRNGRACSIDEVKRALRICSRTILTLISEDQTVELEAPMFPALGLRTRENWRVSGKKTNAFVQFYPLVTEAIKTRQFRQFNYEKSMKLNKTIARQLHKRMSYVYKQASFTNLYSFKLTTIIRDFGLTEYENFGHNLRDLITALGEMKEKRVILSYKIDKTWDIKNTRKKLVDAKITITPDQSFINDTIEANNRATAVSAVILPLAAARGGSDE